MKATAQRMAAAMVALEASRGACTYTDLTEAGFTPADIDRLKHEARATAARMRAAGKPGHVPTTLRQAKQASDRALSIAVAAISRLPGGEPRWSEGFAP